MTFHIGQKVVCVDGQFTTAWNEYRPALPDERAVYTVRDVLVWDFADGPALALRLNEIRHEIRFWTNDYSWSEVAFSARRFRPVVEKKTDISIFTAMLRTDETPLVGDRKQKQVSLEPNLTL